jgi:hypothetical protein
MERETKAVVGLGLSIALLAAGAARAHCDGLDGPVVTAARAALATGDVDRVLISVRPADEAESRASFAHTLEVRKLGPEAQALADRFSFETQVRSHRAGQGAPFTGLAAAGRDLGPAIPAADRALASGGPESLSPSRRGRAPRAPRTLGKSAHDAEPRRARRGASTRTTRSLDAHDVAAGRAYVASYVTFVHWV